MLPGYHQWRAWSVRRRLLDASLSQLAPSLPGRVLEVGARRDGRRGEYAPRLDMAGGRVAVDLSPDAAPHIAADLQALPFRAAAFDCALCLEVLEYVDAPDRAVAELARVLRPGGLLVASAPFLHRRDHSRDRWRWTDAGLRELLARGGFEPGEVTPQGGAWAVVANVLWQLSGRRGAARLAGPLAFLLARPLMRLDRAGAGGFATGFLALARRAAP